jgi:hypothetical protein
VRIRVSLSRFLEAGFLVLVAAAAGLAGLEPLWIGLVMFGAWLLVAFVERAGALGARMFDKSAEPEPVAEEPRPEPERQAEPELVAEEPEPGPEPEPEPVAEVEPEPEPEPKPVLVAVAPPPPEPEPQPEPEPEPEPAPQVVQLVLRDSTPREWNIWELERLAAESDGGDPAQSEERALLLMHMRQFASPSGDLPLEFDPLIREAFGARLGELSQRPA